MIKSRNEHGSGSRLGSTRVRQLIVRNLKGMTHHVALDTLLPYIQLFTKLVDNRLDAYIVANRDVIALEGIMPPWWSG